VLADEHKAYRQTIDHAAGHDHSRVMDDAKGRSAPDYLQRALHVERPATLLLPHLLIHRLF
jgi:hypothetical protein